MSGRILSLLALMFISTAVHAQEMTFESVPLPANDSEEVQSIGERLSAGERKLFLITYVSRTDRSSTRTSLVGVKGKDVQVLFDPYRYAQPPYATEVKFHQYGDKVVVSVENVGAGVDSIWVTDGTTAGTHEISNQNPGATPSLIQDALVAVGQDNSITLVDLTTGVAHLLAGAAAGDFNGQPVSLLPDGRGLISVAGTLYVTDGTIAGSQVLLTGVSESGSSMYISADLQGETSPLRVMPLATTTNGSRLVVSDGTVAGTHLVSTDLLSGNCNGGDYGRQVGSRLIYTWCSPEHGSELWALDLETLQASELKDISPGAASSGIEFGFRSRVNNHLFFMADDGAHGRELWVTDGTPNGTRITRDIAPDTASSVGTFFSEIGLLPSAGPYFAFIASPTGVNPGSPVGNSEELWVSDGTETGTFRVSSSRPGEFSLASSEQEVLLYPSFESFGITFPGETGISAWQQGVFIKVFDPVLGPPASSFLVTRAGTGEILRPTGPVMGAGDYYYMTGPVTDVGVSELLVGSKVLCPGADFKLTAGQCGCGVEEVPADSSGTIASTPQESDGSAVCLTPIGPIFVPKEISGTVTGDLTQTSGRPDSIQITLPSSVINALQMVVTAPQQVRTWGAAMKILGTKVKRATVQHQLKLILVDGAKKTVKSLTLRKGNSGRFKVKLGRRLQKRQKITFQYAVAVTKQSSAYIQTPYVKAGAVKVRKKR